MINLNSLYFVVDELISHTPSNGFETREEAEEFLNNQKNSKNLIIVNMEELSNMIDNNEYILYGKNY